VKFVFKYYGILSDSAMLCGMSYCHLTFVKSSHPSLWCF